MLRALICAMLGGALGALLRVACVFEGLDIFFNILLINFLGSLIVGYVNVALSHERKLLKSFLVKGLCGGFTTFSTFSLICASKMREGEDFYVLAYALLSLFICVSGARAGVFFGRILNIERRFFR